MQPVSCLANENGNDRYPAPENCPSVILCNFMTDSLKVVGAYDD